MLKSRRPPLLARLAADARGVSALEFALIAPLLILIYFGMVELSEAMMAQRRTSHAASTMGDLTSQYDSASNPIYPADMSNIFAAGSQMMAPFDTSTLSERVTSIVMNSSQQPVVAWSNISGGGLPAYQPGATMTVPSGLLSGAGDSVILSETRYQFTSPIGQILPNGLTFNESFYEKPRKTASVTYCASTTGCP